MVLGMFWGFFKFLIFLFFFFSEIEVYAKFIFFCGGSLGQSKINAEKDSKFFSSILEGHSFGSIVDIFAGYGYTFLNNVYLGLNLFVSNSDGDIFFNKKSSERNKLNVENDLKSVNSVELPKNFYSNEEIRLNSYEYDYNTKILNGVNLGVSLQLGYQIFNNSTFYGIFGFENKKLYLNGKEKINLSYSNNSEIKQEFNKLIILNRTDEYLPFLSKIDIADAVNSVYSSFVGIGFKYSFSFLFCAIEMKCNFMKDNLKSNKIEIDEDKVKSENISENDLKLEKEFYESKGGVSVVTYDGKFSFGFNF